MRGKKGRGGRKEGGREKGREKRENKFLTPFSHNLTKDRES